MLDLMFIAVVFVVNVALRCLFAHAIAVVIVVYVAAFIVDLISLLDFVCCCFWLLVARVLCDGYVNVDE
jgi:hypothetical protein